MTKFKKYILSIMTSFILITGVMYKPKEVKAESYVNTIINTSVLGVLLSSLGYKFTNTNATNTTSFNNWLGNAWNTFTTGTDRLTSVLMAVVGGVGVKFKVNQQLKQDLTDFVEYLQTNDEVQYTGQQLYFMGEQIDTNYTIITKWGYQMYCIPVGATYNDKPVSIYIWDGRNTSTLPSLVGYKLYKDNGNTPRLLLVTAINLSNVDLACYLGYYDSNTREHTIKNSNTYSSSISMTTRLTDYGVRVGTYSLSSANASSYYSNLDLTKLPTFNGTLGYDSISSISDMWGLSGTLSPTIPTTDYEVELKDTNISEGATIEEISAVINNALVDNNLGSLTDIVGNINEGIGEQTGILTDIKTGITSLVDTFKNIWVIDNEYITTSIQTTLTKLQGHTGLLTYPVSLTIQFLNMVSNISANDFILTFPHIELIGNQETTFNVSAMVRNDAKLNNFYNIYLTILDGIIAFWLVNLLYEKSRGVFKQ